MRKILISTNNKGKFNEILDVIGDLPFQFLSLNDLNIKEDIEETGKTYEENAQLKAEFFGKISGLPTIADDSGIKIESLKGELGVKTRRRGAGEKASDQEWLDFFLKRMKKEENKNAEFFTSIAFFDGKKTKLFNGKCSGVILERQEGELIKGIPLSSFFIPNGCKIAYGLLKTEEKNKISHRGKACQKFKKYLEECFL